MIQVEEKEIIRRLYFLEGWSRRRIARERRHSRHTVRRALEDPSPPRYQRRAPRPRPVLDPFTGLIARWLEEDEQQPPKQRHTARRIYQRLVSEYGFTGGESTVRQYVRALRPRWQAVMIPLEHDPGEAQVDWGEAKVYVGEQLTTVSLFCLRLCSSQRAVVLAFARESQEAFFAGHVAAFTELGGVPKVITYDNLTTAVRRILTGTRREEQQAFIAFRSHYLFASNFCRPGEGHEKGAVENLVGYARRNFLVPLPRVASLEELNQLLSERCRAELTRTLRPGGETLGQRWAREQPHLLPLPAWPWRCCRTRPAKVSLSSLVAFEGNRYSVPAASAGHSVVVHAYVDRVEIASADTVIAVHRRCYGRGQDLLDPYHYLPVLLHKPRAFRQARAVRQYPWPPAFRQALAFLEERYPDGQGVKEFLRILTLREEVGEQPLGTALALALRYRAVSLDAVRYLLKQLAADWQPPLPLDPVPPGLAAFTVPVRDCAQYNLLLSRS